MDQSATAPLTFAPPVDLPLTVDFQGGRLTSDGGWCWVAEADDDLDLSVTLAAAVPAPRRRGRHAPQTVLRQRLYQITAGYADQNDAETLRADPLLKVLCGRLPETDPDLASQPTLSRFENAFSAQDCYRLAEALGQIYLRERERHGLPSHLLLDLDSTDDPVHGEQEGRAYHGYYQQHMYHPLLVFDGETGQLITAVLRPGTVHAGHGALAILQRIVARLRQQWPGVAITIRADAGFAKPTLFAWCEAEDIAYTIGLVTNPRLLALAAPLAEAAQAASDQAGGTKVRHIGEARYQAGSWDHPRRVVHKAEILPPGPNLRFVVTNRTEDPEILYDTYVDRGQTENWIKDLKRACFADRLSCHRFLANQVRLLLHAAAYTLLHRLRIWLVAAGSAPVTLETLRLRLLKIGGRVRQLASRIHLRLASSHPGEPLWHLLAAARGRS